MATSPLSANNSIDVRGIVSALMDVERQPLNRLESRAQGLRSTISEFGKLQSSMDALKTAARGLSATDTWRAATATSADESAVEIAAAEGALQGNYSIKVTQLASHQTIVSDTAESPEAVVGGGTLTIQLGTNDEGFTADPERDPVTLTIPAGATLAELSDAINASDAGIGASLVTDAEGTRIMIRSSESGKEQAFQITGVSDGSGEGLSLADLSYTVGQTGGTVTATQDASNARFELNGLELESATNNPEGVLENVSLTLRKKTADPVEVEISTDNESIRTKLDEFVTAYNEVNSLIRTQTSYNAETNTGGPLQGNRMVILSQTKLRETLTSSMTPADGEEAGAFTRLSDIGIEIGRDGSLSLNESRFEVAAAKTRDLSELFSARGLNGASDGIARQLVDDLDDLLDTDGAVGGATNTLRDRERDLQDQQDAMERRLEDIETRLLRQYTNLDANLAVLTNSLTQVSRLG